MPTEEEVLRAVGKAIERYGEGPDVPPFTEEQLVVMAILYTQKPISPKEAYDWVLNNFNYFVHLAREGLWALPYLHPRDHFPPEGQRAEDFRNNLEKAFWQYEIPFKTKRDEHGTLRFDISLTEGRQFLSTALNLEKPAKTFPFFRLPSEIRDNIYEYLFQYPKSGIMVVDYNSPLFGGSPNPDQDRQLVTLSRSIEDEYSFSRWYDHPQTRFPKRLESPYADFYLRSRALKDILAPLATSRQFYSEAMPIFYSSNRFCFDRAYDLGSVFKALAPKRRKHIRHVSFYFARMKFVDSPARELVNLEGLRKLDVYFQHGTFEIADGEEDVPGLADLCKVRGLEEVTLGGDRHYERIKARLMDNLLQPKGNLAVERAVERET